ncbi:MAG TPA: cyclic nucleotide-binding domain-containing protein [Myxococcota bacterium]|nr:cyclic nucleotide-binding domain-containing protein [Myxococcota bacterium]
MTKIELFRHVENPKRYAAGEVIFREGEPGECMYAVVEGEVEVRCGERLIERTGEGGVVGELALIDRGPRSATAVAATPCLLAPVDDKQFQYLVQQAPFFALQVMRVLAERLRRQT